MKQQYDVKKIIITGAFVYPIVLNELLWFTGLLDSFWPHGGGLEIFWYRMAIYFLPGLVALFYARSEGMSVSVTLILSYIPIAAVLMTVGYILTGSLGVPTHTVNLTHITHIKR